MTREKHQTQLAKLHEDVLAMSTLVMECFQTGLDAPCERAGKTLIRNLIETERQTHAPTENLTQNIFWLALRDLERIGDHAVNITARTLSMSDNDVELIE